jgi:hypothetical protein
MLANFQSEMNEKLKKILKSDGVMETKVIEALKNQSLSAEDKAFLKLYFKVKSAIQHYNHLDERVLAESQDSSDEE